VLAGARDKRSSHRECGSKGCNGHILAIIVFLFCSKRYFSNGKAKTNRTPASDALSRALLFGPPPVIEGEKVKDYRKLLERVFEAVEPCDFIEEIWARDLADVTWSMFRLRRILAALLDDEVRHRVNDEASSRAEKEAKKLLEGAEKEEMDRLLDENSELDWEERVAQHPRANAKFQALWSKARSDLNFDLIQARAITYDLDRIERIEALIAIAQRRIDEVIRELDRHRVIRGQFNKFRVAVDDTKAAPPKMITGKVINKKVA
jgi:hypothetical protein